MECPKAEIVLSSARDRKYGELEDLIIVLPEDVMCDGEGVVWNMEGE